MLLLLLLLLLLLQLILSVTVISMARYLTDKDELHLTTRSTDRFTVCSLRDEFRSIQLL